MLGAFVLAYLVAALLTWPAMYLLIKRRFRKNYTVAWSHEDRVAIRRVCTCFFLTWPVTWFIVLWMTRRAAMT